MNWFKEVDWRSIFVPDTPLLEIFVRGSLVYLALYFLLRLILKRQMGSIGLTDLLVLVLIADAAQNAMAADYKSLPDGIALTITLIFWNFVLDWLGFHVSWFEKFLHPNPLLLVKNGRILPDNMRKELIARSELMSQLREQGIDDIRKVKEAYLEGDGKISIIEKEPSQKRHKPLDNPQV